MTRLGKVSTDGKTDKVIVELCRIAGKVNSLFVQINQNHHGMKHRPLIVRLLSRYLVSSLTACGNACVMKFTLSVSVKPKMSTLSVAWLRRFPEACGQMTRSSQIWAVHDVQEFLIPNCFCKVLLEIHQSHPKGKQDLCHHS